MAVLTTIAGVKALAGLTGTGNDALLTSLVTQVSDQVQEFTDRDFLLQTHTRWLDGNGRRRLFLPEWPIRSVQAISLDVQDVGDIEFTGGTVATVGASETALELFSIDTAGTEVETTLTFAANKTLADLKTAIEAVSGWTFNIRAGKTTQPSKRIRPFVAENALNPETVEVWLAEDSQRGRTVDGTNRMIEILDVFQDRFAEPRTVSMVQRGTVFPFGSSNVYVRWKAGYDLPPDPATAATVTIEALPAGLELIVQQIIVDVFERRKSPALKSRRLGDFGETFDVSTIESAVRSRAEDLQHYRTVEFVGTI